MEYKTSGTMKGDKIILDSQIPIQGRVKVIIVQELEQIITKSIILEFLKDKFKEWKEIYHIERIGIFGSYARDEQKQESDIDIILKFKDKPKDLYEIKTKIRDCLEEKFHKKVDLANEIYIKSIHKEEILKEAIYVTEG